MFTSCRFLQVFFIPLGVRVDSPRTYSPCSLINQDSIPVYIVAITNPLVLCRTVMTCVSVFRVYFSSFFRTPPSVHVVVYHNFSFPTPLTHLRSLPFASPSLYTLRFSTKRMRDISTSINQRFHIVGWNTRTVLI